jgi:hypothetical protein
VFIKIKRRDRKSGGGNKKESYLSYDMAEHEFHQTLLKNPEA